MLNNASEGTVKTPGLRTRVRVGGIEGSLVALAVLSACFRGDRRVDIVPIAYFLGLTAKTFLSMLCLASYLFG